MSDLSKDFSLVEILTLHTERESEKDREKDTGKRDRERERERERKKRLVSRRRGIKWIFGGYSVDRCSIIMRVSQTPNRCTSADTHTRT